MDTGFHRLGFDVTREAADELAREARGLTWLRLTGMFSHLGLITAQRDQAQYDALMRMQSMMEQRGLQLKDIHLCDSIGLVR